MRPAKLGAEFAGRIVPPGLFKNEYQASLGQVWQQATKELEEAEEIIVIGYLLPETDFFFRNLFALGIVGRKFIRRFAVVNTDESGRTKGRFESLLGQSFKQGTRKQFEYLLNKFVERIEGLAQTRAVTGSVQATCDYETSNRGLWVSATLPRGLLESWISS